MHLGIPSTCTVCAVDLLTRGPLAQSRTTAVPSRLEGEIPSDIYSPHSIRPAQGAELRAGSSLRTAQGIWALEEQEAPKGLRPQLKTPEEHLQTVTPSASRVFRRDIYLSISERQLYGGPSVPTGDGGQLGQGGGKALQRLCKHMHPGPLPSRTPPVCQSPASHPRGSGSRTPGTKVL